MKKDIQTWFWRVRDISATVRGSPVRSHVWILNSGGVVLYLYYSNSAERFFIVVEYILQRCVKGLLFWYFELSHYHTQHSQLLAHLSPQWTLVLINSPCQNSSSVVWQSTTRDWERIWRDQGLESVKLVQGSSLFLSFSPLHINLTPSHYQFNSLL